MKLRRLRSGVRACLVLVETCIACREVKFKSPYENTCDAFLVALTRRGGTFSPRWRIVLRTLFAAAFCRCECSAGRRAA